MHPKVSPVIVEQQRNEIPDEPVVKETKTSPQQESQKPQAGKKVMIEEVAEKNPISSESKLDKAFLDDCGEHFPIHLPVTDEMRRKASEFKKQAKLAHDNKELESSLFNMQIINQNVAILEAAILYGMGVHEMGGRTANLFTDRAEVFLELQKPRCAKRDCDKALEQNPYFARAFKIRAKAHIMLGNIEKGKADMEAAAKTEQIQASGVKPENMEKPKASLQGHKSETVASNVNYKTDKSWITPELLSKVAKDKELSEALYNPQYAEIIGKVSCACFKPFLMLYYFTRLHKIPLPSFNMQTIQKSWEC